MGIVRPLHGRIRIVAFFVSDHPDKRQTQHLGQFLADLVLGHSVFGRELEDLGQMFGRPFLLDGLEVFDHDIAADSGDILRVGGVALRPVVHLDARVFILGLLDRVDQRVHRTLGVILGGAVQHRHAQNDTQPRLFGRFQDGDLPIPLQLPVKIRRLRFRISFVGCISFGSRENVVRRDIQQESSPGRRLFGEDTSGVDVNAAGELGVLFARIGRAVRGAFNSIALVNIIMH